MKRILIIALTIWSGLQINAQDNQGLRQKTSQDSSKVRLTPEQRAIRQFRLLQSEIGVDEAQAEKVKQVFNEFQNRRQEVMDKYRGKSEAARKEMKAHRDAMDKKLEEILGAEKFQQWVKVRKAKAEQKRMQKRQGNPGPALEEEID